MARQTGCLQCKQIERSQYRSNVSNDHMISVPSNNNQFSANLFAVLMERVFTRFMNVFLIEILKVITQTIANNIAFRNDKSLVEITTHTPALDI